MTGAPRGGRWVVATGVTLAGVFMLVFGFWAWLAPYSFAEFVAYPVHVHFLHDAGVFQIGIGVGLLASLAYADAITVVLAGFLTANTLHAVNHAVDLHLGGRVSDPFALGALSLMAGIALFLRVRQLRQNRRNAPAGEER